MNKLSERFEQKIPTFLAHLDVWNDTPMNTCCYTTHDYNRAMRKQNLQKICVICGKPFACTHYNKKQQCCSRKCGVELARKHRTDKIAKRKATMKGV